MVRSNTDSQTLNTDSHTDSVCEMAPQLIENKYRLLKILKILVSPAQCSTPGVTPGDPPPLAKVGEYCFLFSEDGVQQNTLPYCITAIATGPDGQRYARFRETDGGWLLARCARTSAPDDAHGVVV